MGDFVSALTTGITPTTIFNAIEPIAPLVVTGVLVGLALHFARRGVNKLAKGKGGI